ncbi:hypothetical protein INR49_019751 [Caranx melampygus]|nr:hypothetical protein INR49_019751 [Caranx melampygus]
MTEVVPVHITQLYEENTNKRPVLTSQPNGLAPISSTRPGLPLPDRQTSASEPAHHCRQSSATSNKSMDSKPKPNPLSPEQAMKQFMSKMSSFEHHEVFSYPEGDFLCGSNAKKRSGVMGGANNGGYDDDQGSYIHVPHDHISYRYEVLKSLAKAVSDRYDQNNW